MNPTWETWIYSTASLLHGLLHLAALILSLVFWRRHPKVCALVLAGSVLSMFVVVARTVLPMLWFRNFDDRMTFAFISLGMSLLGMVGIGLYLTAIFTGRGAHVPQRLRPARREDDDWDRPAPVPPKSAEGGTGIQEYQA